MLFVPNISNWWENMLKILLLTVAVCTDGFAASLGMGAAGIKIPLRSELIISLAGTLFLTLSAAFSDVFSRFLPEEVCAAVSFVLLISLGVFNLFQDFFKKLLIRRKRTEKATPTEMFFDGTAADTDNSKSISPREAVVLSAALSADSLITGAGAGLDRLSLPVLAALAAAVFGVSMLSLAAGQRLGRKLVTTFNISLGWLCGAVLILLAFLK